MKVLIDHQILSRVLADPASFSRQEHELYLGWSSLLELLGLGSLFSTLPSFDDTNPLFIATVATLCSQEEKDVVVYIYDHLFAESLNQIQGLDQINASFLLEAIKKQPHAHLFSASLTAYKEAFEENPSHAMHDLILYLAWDRMCVWMARLFDHPSTDAKFIQGLEILKECLIESYQYIARQGRTVPGLFRMIEALFFYEMREENLQKHPEADFALLSQSFPVLTQQDALMNADYVDYAVVHQLQAHEERSAFCVMSDSSERVDAKVSLASWMIQRFPEWEFVLNSPKLTYLH